MWWHRSQNRNITLLCWILGVSDDSLSVDIDDDRLVSHLKQAILETRPFPNVFADQLRLWRVSLPDTITDTIELANAIAKLDLTERNSLRPGSRLSDIFPPPQPIGGLVHIIVRLPAQKREFSPFPSSTGLNREFTNLTNAFTPPPPLTSFPCCCNSQAPNFDLTGAQVIAAPARTGSRLSVPGPPDDVVPRNATVEALYQRLQNYGFIQVRGTPGSGKTTLGQLLARHILQDPNMNVIWIDEWPVNEVKGCGGFWAYLEHVKGWKNEENTVFIFDEAQLTYWDEQLWRDCFRMLMDYKNLRAIAFASYGSPAYRFVLGGTRIDLIEMQRVTLKSIPHKDYIPPVGLLLSAEEMADFASSLYPQPEYHFDSSFFDSLFALTGGHVGATRDFVTSIATHRSYRGLQSSPGYLYTWDRFMRLVGPRDLLDLLGHATRFNRGLPPVNYLTDPVIVSILSTVLGEGYVTDAHFESESDALNKLQLCFRNGWLHTDSLRDWIDTVAYFFASSLHRWYVEWKLFEMLPAVPIQAGNILNFMITTISGFSPKRLAAEGRIGPSGLQRPLETQYQDEFYRSCRICSKGSIVTFPESEITKSGRADFYIPANEWGVELVRDGNLLDQHSGRFSQEASYMTALPVSDYIILDFCNTSPREAHQDIQKLYHVVFGNDFHDVSILDNMLEPVVGGTLQLQESSKSAP